MSLVVQLPKFEGPLALLLYLIRKEEMDIFDIKIHEITNQYLEYIKIMKELDLELAGEFVAMAATLIQIKSRMLLPQYDEKGEVIEVEDPRKELVQKLLEYQKYQEAAKLLYDRPLVGRDMWTRGFRESLDEPPEEIEVEDNGLFSLISVYRLIMRSTKKRVHQVTAKAQSIASRILEIKDMLIMGQRKTLNDLIGIVDDKTRQVLITFLSLLELGKLGFVSLYQTENYTDIWVELRKPIEGDAVSRVEEYDTIHSNEVADKLFSSNIRDGAKTGFFLDQRDNRNYIRDFSKNKNVLNLFSYTGGFSIYAAAGGASSVTSVDIAKAAISAVERNFAINKLTTKQESLAVDAFQYVQDCITKQIKFDFVITDPPSFAPNEKSVPQATAAYTKIFSDSLRLVKDNGYFVASSCSSHIHHPAFIEIIKEAFSKAKRTGTLIHFGGQPSDHPFPLAMEELRYLKFAFFRLD